MTSKSLYDKDYEIIEHQFTNNIFEFICNQERKHIIGFICKFYDENGNTIKTSEESTLNIYNIFLDETIEIPRFLQSKTKLYFTANSSNIDQIKYDEDQWSYFMNVNKNNCKFRFVFNLIFDEIQYSKINMKLILIYDRIFTKKDSENEKEYNHLGMPFLGYYLDHISDLKYLSDN